MSEQHAGMNGVGTSKEEAIDLDNMGTGSPEVGSSGTLDQLDGNTTVPAATTEPKSATPENQLSKDMQRVSAAAEHGSPLFVSQGSPSPSDAEVGEALHPDLIERNGLAVVIPRLENLWEYRRYDDPATVVEILEEYDDGGFIEYLVQFDDESEKVVSPHGNPVPDNSLAWSITQSSLYTVSSIFSSCVPLLSSSFFHLFCFEKKASSTHISQRLCCCPIITPMLKPSPIPYIAN
jgi:hypothetical protein